jgi:hypothetical protein
VDFKGIFSKLTKYGYASWAVMEWECAIKSPEQGAREGAPFIRVKSLKPPKKRSMILPVWQPMKHLIKKS